MPPIQILPPPPDYDRNAIFALNGPISPTFVTEAVRTLIRTLPLETGEPAAWVYRRMATALDALAALHPRDEIELMLCVQAVAAYHAASAGWHLGMNLQHPRGDSTRHVTVAASAARTFDSLLKALERRQAKPLGVPPGRPDGRTWDEDDPGNIVGRWHVRVAGAPANDDEAPAAMWTEEACHIVEELRDQETLAEDYGDLDLANTPGILPGGGMIVPEDPTAAQQAYLIRRYALNLRKQYQANLQAGHNTLPKIIPFRPGDLIP